MRPTKYTSSRASYTHTHARSKSDDQGSQAEEAIPDRERLRSAHVMAETDRLREEVNPNHTMSPLPVLTSKSAP